jgi:hypothetical protein
LEKGVWGKNFFLKKFFPQLCYNQTYKPSAENAKDLLAAAQKEIEK